MRRLLLSALCFLLPLPSFAGVDPALLALMPQGMSLITGLDADRARSSSFGQYMLNRVRNGDAHFEQFVKETGFDPRRDLQSFVFAGSGGGKGEGRFAILARGIFDESRMKAAVKAHGATVESYKRTDLFVSTKTNAPATGFAFLDSTTAVLADTVTLKQVLDERDTAPAVEPALQIRMKQANEANDAWYVSSLPGSVLASKLRTETGAPAAENSGVLRGVVESSGGIRFGDVVQLSFDALTRSPEDATSLTDLLRFLASAAQMQRDSDPRAAILASSLDSLSLEKNGRNVHAGLSLTEGNLERLMNSRPRAKSTARSRRESRP